MLISWLARNFLKSAKGVVNFKITSFLTCVRAMSSGLNGNVDIRSFHQITNLYVLICTKT